MTNNYGNTGPENLIRGGQLFWSSFYTGRTTFVYGADNFFDPHFIRGEELFWLKIFWGNTGRTTFWTLILYGAKNFFHSKFSKVIRGRQLFGPSFYTGQTTFLSQNFLSWDGVESFWTLVLYGADNFFDHFFRCYTGQETNIHNWRIWGWSEKWNQSLFLQRL